MKRHAIVLSLAVFACNGGTAGAPGAQGPAGFNGNDGHDTLTNLVDVAAGALCANGGVTIQFGVDKDDNGTLAASEVTTTKTICNGAGGTQGTQGDTGAPGANGANGKDFMIPQFVGSTTEPGTPNPDFYISSRGATGDVTAGGAGGPVTINVNGTVGTLGGHVKVFRTGSAGPSGTNEAALPTAPSGGTNLGTAGVIISSSTTITAAATTVAAQALAAGTLTTIQDDPHPGQVYEALGASQIRRVSSLRINAGVTVNFTANGGGFTTISVPGDVVNNGTFVAAAGTGTKLVISCSSYHGSATSQLNTTGTNPNREISITATDFVFNAGQVTAQGSPVTFTSLYRQVYNTGAINTSAGGGSVAAGGSVSFSAPLGVYNSGPISTHGSAAGAAATSGASGAITFTAVGQLNNAGPMMIRNTGALDASGISCSATTCVGGAGGNITFLARGGPSASTKYVAIASAGDISANGGSSTNLTVGNRGNGGPGGTILIRSNDQAGSTTLGNVTTVAGSIYLSGNITSDGGSGVIGGAGGDITVNLRPSTGVGQEIVMLGYSFINSSGGPGMGGAGGVGGAVSITNAGDNGGGVVNGADVATLGGDSYAAAAAGNGANVLLSSANSDVTSLATSGEVAINSGKLWVSGGGSTGGNGGLSGTIKIVGAIKVENHGVLQCSDAFSANLAGGATMPAGNGAGVTLLSGAGPVTSDANILCDGGDASSSGTATQGKPIVLEGTTVTVSGALSSQGGSGSGAAVGNDGGVINLLSTAGTTTSTATYSVNGGSSAKTVTPGWVVIDGKVVSP